MLNLGDFRMRELTQNEGLELFERHQCPFCHCATFYEGPRGCASYNIYCANDRYCGAGFCVGPGGIGSGVICEPGEPQGWKGTLQERERKMFNWTLLEWPRYG